jgi:hypothetical protein
MAEKKRRRNQLIFRNFGDTKYGLFEIDVQFCVLLVCMHVMCDGSGGRKKKTEKSADFQKILVRPKLILKLILDDETFFQPPQNSDGVIHV